VRIMNALIIRFINNKDTLIFFSLNGKHSGICEGRGKS